jgi:hypothetical protein
MTRGIEDYMRRHSFARLEDFRGHIEESPFFSGVKTETVAANE